MPCSVSLFNSVFSRPFRWPWKIFHHLHQISPIRCSFVLAFFSLSLFFYSRLSLVGFFSLIRWWLVDDDDYLSSDCNQIERMFVSSSGFNIQRIVTVTCEIIIIIMIIIIVCRLFLLPNEVRHPINTFTRSLCARNHREIKQNPPQKKNKKQTNGAIERCVDVALYIRSERANQMTKNQIQSLWYIYILMKSNFYFHKNKNKIVCSRHCSRFVDTIGVPEWQQRRR